MEINQKLYGFTLVRKTEIPETDSYAYLFSHEKSGARLFFLENDDDNKVFSISFRTPPTDDTGVAHIVEHSVLCGSRKYPLKEPFVELVKGSLNTFLNAMTYPDKTMYPVASRNAKDFQNLMDVYLDAVFYPAMRENPQILMQEGWHYEIENPNDPLTYSGVVYNEMKGALSSSEDLLESCIMTSLFPDTTYGRESGGDPAAIPALTQDAFIGFHSKYYHPSNSYIFLYGDMDIEEKLKYLDEAYLSHFDKIPVPSKIERQKPFTKTARMRKPYPIATGEQTEEKTFLAKSWLVGDVLDMKTMMGLEILEHALLRTQAAPLRKALLDAKLGKDVDSIFENEVLQPFFSIILDNSDEKYAEDFERVVQETLEKIVNDGIDRKLFEASINLLEFRLRESDFGATPKGLVYGIRSMRSWLYDGEPETALRYEENLHSIKEALDHGYFEELIRTYLLENPHKSFVILYPDTEMRARRDKEQEEKLASIKQTMSEKEIEAAIKSARALKQRQQAPETEEALASIPMLSLSDIRKEAYDLPLEEREVNGVKVLFSNVPTNGILYLTLFFDAQTVPQEDLFYLYLLSDILSDVDTEKRGYAELANAKNLLTGGISIDVMTYAKKNVPDSSLPKFRVKVKALTEKLPKVFALLEEILTKSSFTDGKRIRALIEQEETSIALGLQRAANQIIVSRLDSYLSDAGAYTDAGILPFYSFLKGFQEDFDNNLKKMQQVFAGLLTRVINTNHLIASVTMAARDYDAFVVPFKQLLASLSKKKFPVQKYHWEHKAKNEGLMSASQVQYVAKGADYMRLGYAYTGSMNVLMTMLRYDYFWTKIRVQGGAYGAFTNFTNTGFMYFGSYRDPHLKETLDVFDRTAEYVKNFDASDREMDKFIIGTMSTVDAPLTPKMKGELAASCYLRGFTKADRQKARDEILNTRQQDIRNLAPMIDACMKENILCVFGGEEAIRGAKDVFGEIKNAL